MYGLTACEDLRTLASTKKNLLPFFPGNNQMRTRGSDRTRPSPNTHRRPRLRSASPACLEVSSSSVAQKTFLPFACVPERACVTAYPTAFALFTAETLLQPHPRRQSTLPAWSTMRRPSWYGRTFRGLISTLLQSWTSLCHPLLFLVCVCFWQLHLLAYMGMNIERRHA